MLRNGVIEVRNEDCHILTPLHVLKYVKHKTEKGKSDDINRISFILCVRPAKGVRLPVRKSYIIGVQLVEFMSYVQRLHHSHSLSFHFLSSL